MQFPLRQSDPRRIGRYTLVARLGQGGMGVVYLGRDEAGGLVAVKVLRQELTYDDQFRGRFRGEISRIRQVPPFCTAAVLDADPDHDPPYLVVEFVDGPSLTRRVAEHGPMGQADLHSVALGTATALAAIHGAGVIHRDLKPDNVLFAMGGVKVIDFGIARGLEMTSAHTRTGQMVGTVAYMAPERFESVGSAPADPASDVFAWAAVVAYAATGRAPFDTDSVQGTAVRILTQPPDLTGVPASLRGLLERALQKDPRLRPTARELLDLLLPRNRPADVSAAVAGLGPPTHRLELQNFVTGQVQPLRPAPGPRRRTRRLGVAAAAAAAALLLLVGAGAVLALAPWDGPRRAGEQLTTAAPSRPPSTPPRAIASGPAFVFTVRGWSGGRLRVTDPTSVSTAYQTANVLLGDEPAGTLTVYRPGAFDPAGLDGTERVTVGGRPARWDETYPTTPNNTDRMLAWQYADNAWATIQTVRDGQPSFDQLRSLAGGLRTGGSVVARLPFRLTYVPKGYQAVEVGTQVETGAASPAQYGDAQPAAVVFAGPAPKPTGLLRPWDPKSEGARSPIKNNFLVSVALGTQHKVGASGCLDGFCYLWTGDGRTRIDVVSFDRLSDREALKLLDGLKLGPMDDPGGWFDANTAVQGRA
ncbi:serine/threonine-protein kinase [Actinoplanes sp. NPDC089786]|uniref:serine/threonine protein kinase n=1 Tax=Actinoplanes sp. NPDC089786 TaxID=3155185 RepID=UPI003428D50C